MNSLTKYLKKGQVFECNELWNLNELEKAGVAKISNLKAISPHFPIYIKLQSCEAGEYKFTWANEPKDYAEYGYPREEADYTVFINFEKFYNMYGIGEENRINEKQILDNLLKSDNPDVRIALAKEGYGLETLVHDKNYQVRAAVAEQGYGLNILVNDGDDYVRRVVAKQGYGLEKLVHDEDARVRLAVAKQGYGYDILKDDCNEDIREIATIGIEEFERRQKIEEGIEEEMEMD